MTQALPAAAILAALAVPALAAPAQGPRIVGDAANRSVVHDAPSMNVVGGAQVRVSGPADQRQDHVLRVERSQAPGPVRAPAQAIVVDSAS